ncbi:hypothetical protein [Sulfitobacter indolifex]|uniref:hypothetical protein n=1 Tax=Sulfitobacter indolifex TaxID=225422 RepID=UPI001040C280|nr:hypothetical protein [Sulfitobacter indolifex]
MEVPDKTSLTEVIDFFAGSILKSNALAATTGLAAHAHTTTNGWEIDPTSYALGWCGISALGFFSIWHFLGTVSSTLNHIHRIAKDTQRNAIVTYAMEGAVIVASLASTFTVINVLNGLVAK